VAIFNICRFETLDSLSMRRMKSTSHRSHMVAASSSSIEDDMSLGVDEEEAPAPTRDAASSSAVSRRRGGVPSHGINSPTSTRHFGRTTFQCKFVPILVFFNYNIINE